VFFGNADGAADSTRIVVRRGDPGAGRDVRDALGMGRVTIVPGEPNLVSTSRARSATWIRMLAGIDCLGAAGSVAGRSRVSALNVKIGVTLLF